MTEDTFTRVTLVEACKKAFSNRGPSGPMAFPGPRSIWIMDGAKIHCHPAVFDYLRSVGLAALYLPAYCPFYNPIEIFFGRLKSLVKKDHPHGFESLDALKLAIAAANATLRHEDVSPYFRKCGYGRAGCFDPRYAFPSVHSSPIPGLGQWLCRYFYLIRWLIFSFVEDGMRFEYSFEKYFA
jgi:hypothetical protein